MKKILVAHDLSRRSSIALERAVQLAQQRDCALDVLHVIEDDLPAAVIERRKHEATELIDAELTAEPYVAVVSDVHVLVGRDYTDILAWADTSCADLIVLGAHREDALRPIVIGTTAERLIGFGARPVLVVKNPPAGEYTRIVVAVDFTAPAREAAAFAFELLPESEFWIVHATPRTVTPSTAIATPRTVEEIHADLQKFLPNCPARTRLIVCHGSPVAEIRERVKHFNAELLVLGGQRRAGLTRALIGAIPEDLLAALPCDLMVIKPDPDLREAHRLGG